MKKLPPREKIAAIALLIVMAVGILSCSNAQNDPLLTDKVSSPNIEIKTSGDNSPAIYSESEVKINYPNNSWYECGHIDKHSPCVFIVNDSIKIIARETVINNLEYCVYVNNIENGYTYTYHSAHDNKKSLVDYLERRYNKGIPTVKITESSNYNDCFKY